MPHAEISPPPDFMTARFVNAALGLWLFISVFAWHHTTEQAVNVALTGIFIALTALAQWTVGERWRVRLVNAALGFWLLVSIIAFPRSSVLTLVNSAIVGALVCAVAVLPVRRSSVAAERPASG